MSAHTPFIYKGFYARMNRIAGVVGDVARIKNYMPYYRRLLRMPGECMVIRKNRRRGSAIDDPKGESK